MKFWRKLPRKQRIASVLIVWMGLVVAGLSAAPDFDPNDAAFRRVSNRLLCQCGCNYMVLSCNHVDCPSATYIRKTIQTSLAAGKSEDAIIASFVEAYGARILPEPPKEGFNWMAWIMPFVALVLGGGMVSYVLVRWMRQPNAEEAEVTAAEDDATAESGSVPKPQPVTSTALVEKYREQIDQELREED